MTLPLLNEARIALGSAKEIHAVTPIADRDRRVIGDQLEYEACRRLASYLTPVLLDVIQLGEAVRRDERTADPIQSYATEFYADAVVMSPIAFRTLCRFVRLVEEAEERSRAMPSSTGQPA